MLKLCKGLSPGKPISIGGFNVSPSKNPLKLNIPLNGSIIPLKGMQAVPSFNRNTTATVVDYEGVIHTALINEIRFPGDRRVRNLLSNAEVLSTQTVTVLSGSSYILSFSGTGSVTLSGAATGTLTGTTGRVQFIKTASTTSLTLTVSGAVLQAQLERLTGTQIEASEYVSTGVLSWPYHGAGVDGVKYFTINRDGSSLDVNGALIEPSATNLLSYSIAYETLFSNGAVAYTVDTEASPDGGYNGRVYTFSSGSQTNYAVVSVTAGAVYCFSQWVALGTALNAGYAIYNNTNSTWIVAATQYTGLTTTLQRKKVTFTVPATCTSIRIYPIRYIDNSNIGTVRLFGAQLDLSTLTSYIPTSGTAVTRTADVLSYDIGEVITQGQGSWYCEFKYSYSTGYPRIFELTDNTSSNTIIVRITNTKYFEVLVTTGGVNQATITTSTQISDNTLYKVLLTYKNNSIKLYLNGVLVGEDLSCTVPNLLKLFTGGTGAGSGQLNGYINNFKYFREVLSGAESIRKTS